MLLFTNENDTSTLHSEIEALPHASFTTIRQYLNAKIVIIFDNVFNFSKKYQRSSNYITSFFVKRESTSTVMTMANVSTPVH